MAQEHKYGRNRMRDDEWRGSRERGDYGSGGEDPQARRDQPWSGAGRDPGRREDYWGGNYPDEGARGSRPYAGEFPESGERGSEPFRGDYGRPDYRRGEWSRSQPGYGRPGFGPEHEPGHRYGTPAWFDHEYGRRGEGWRGEGWRGREASRAGRGGEERGFFERAADEVSSWFGDKDAEQRRHMDEFRGRGPKNYARSPERIREDVCDRLTDDWAVDASDIEVAVSGTEVTLSGTVPSRDQRRRAEDCAEHVSGVTHVQNNVRVKEQHQGAFAGTASQSEAARGATSTGATGTAGKPGTSRL